MTREQSQHYWTHEHVRVGTTLNDPTPYAPRYVQNHTLPDFHAEKPEYDFAGAPELWFKSEEAARRMFFERSEEHTSELKSLMRISYAVFCLKKKKKTTIYKTNNSQQT